MPDPSPTDPIAILRSLIAAFERGASGGAPSAEATPHLATAAGDPGLRLARIEERLALLEARAAEDARRDVKKKRKVRRD